MTTHDIVRGSASNAGNRPQDEAPRAPRPEDAGSAGDEREGATTTPPGPSETTGPEAEITVSDVPEDAGTSLGTGAVQSVYASGPAGADRVSREDAGAPASSGRRGTSRMVRFNSFSIGLAGGLGVLLALVIGGLISQLGTVLMYIGIAVFVALGLDPLVSWLEHHLARPLAIAVVVLAAVVVFAGIMLLVVPTMVTQISEFVSSLPKNIDALRSSALGQSITSWLSGVIDVNSLIDTVTTFLGDQKNWLSIGGGLLKVGAGVANAVTGAIVVMILTLYFLASLRPMKALACRFVPARRRDRFAAVMEEITHTVGRYVVGQASLAAINGVCSFVFLNIIKAPNPALLALIAFCGSLIPLIGTLSGSIVISLICLFASPATALAAAVYYLIYMQVEAYVFSPRIMSKAVSVPGAIVVIAAVAGGTIGGVLGALVAIPVAASAIIIVQKVVFPIQDAKL